MNIATCHVHTNAEAANLPPPPPASAAGIPAPPGPHSPHAMAEAMTEQLALAAAACAAASEAASRGMCHPRGELSPRARASLQITLEAATAAARVVVTLQGLPTASQAQVPRQVQKEKPAQLSPKQLRQPLPQDQPQPKPLRPKQLPADEQQQYVSKQPKQEPEARHRAQQPGPKALDVDTATGQGQAADTVAVALDIGLWKHVVLRWTFVRPDKCLGSNLKDITLDMSREALESLESIGAIPKNATCLADCKWDMVVQRILHKYPGPMQPELESRGGWAWALTRVPTTKSERRANQELGAWALDCCFTELQARRAFKPVASTPERVIYQAVGNWEVYRVMAEGLSGNFSAVTVGDVFECAATWALGRRDWKALQCIVQHIHHVVLRPPQGEDEWTLPEDYLGGLDPQNPISPRV